MIKINHVTLSASITSANLTSFDFQSIPQAVRGLTHMWTLDLPECSADDTSATLLYKDENGNTLWTSTSNIYDDAAAVTGEKVELAIAGAGEYFSLTLNQRCSGVDDTGAAGTAYLYLWVQQEG